MAAGTAQCQVEVDERATNVSHQLVALRNGYEEKFTALVEALPMLSDTDPSLLRLMLIGALNHVPPWYREGGETPSCLARLFIANLRFAQDCSETHKEET